MGGDAGQVRHARLHQVGVKWGRRGLLRDQVGLGRIGCEVLENSQGEEYLLRRRPEPRAVGRRVTRSAPRQCRKGRDKGSTTGEFSTFVILSQAEMLNAGGRRLRPMSLRVDGMMPAAHWTLASQLPPDDLQPTHFITRPFTSSPPQPSSAARSRSPCRRRGGTGCPVPSQRTPLSPTRG